MTDTTNAAIDLDRKKSNIVKVFASTGIERKDTKYKAGAFRNFDTTNRFNLYRQLSLSSPHVFIPLQKLALTLVKGIRFEGKSSLVKNFEKWSERINFEEKTQTLARLLCRDGTYVGLYNNVKNPDKMGFEPLLMSQTTIVPRGVTKGSTDVTFILTPPINRFYVNERGNLNDLEAGSYRPDQVMYGSFCANDYTFRDILGRETYGIYGTSLITPIEDLIYKYLELVEGYTKYIKKYGIGRYFIDYRILGDMLASGDISMVEAQEIMQELSDEHQYIEENQDIIGAGFDIKQLDSGGSNINVTGFKESLETDIQVGLLQAPLTMGRAEGTTYAAGYVSEADRLVVLEGLQKKIMSILNDEGGIIKQRAVAMGKNPDDIRVVFEELSKPAVQPGDLLDAYTMSVINKPELRVSLGFPKEMIEKDERDNGDNTIELLKRGRKGRKPTDNGMKYPSEE